MALEVNQRMPIESESDRVLLFGISMPIALATSPMRFAHGKTVSDRLWLMSSDAMTFTIRRTGPSRLEILSEKGMINEIEQSVRDLSRESLKEGQVIKTDGLELEVEKLDEAGHPTKLALQLDPDHMDDMVIVSWTGKAFQRSALPEEGSELVLNLGVGVPSPQ